MIDRFSKFPYVLLTKTFSAKKVFKLLNLRICIYGIPQWFRTDFGSGFKNELVNQFCTERGIKHFLTPVADQRGNGLVERRIQTVKRKLGTEKIDLNFDNLKTTLQLIVEDIRKLKILLSRNLLLTFILGVNIIPNLLLNKIANEDTLAQGFEKKMLIPDQIASQDYSKDRAKLVPHGSSSPHDDLARCLH